MSQRAAVILGHASTPFGLSGRQKKRLDKGIELLRLGKADLLVTTGGVGLFNPSPPPLGWRMKDYLIHRGIPEQQILAEDKSKNTRQNAQFIVPLLDKNIITSLIVITSADHMPRARQISRATVPPDIELNFVVSDYASGLWTLWDTVWHSAGWLKYVINSTLMRH